MHTSPCSISRLSFYAACFNGLRGFAAMDCMHKGQPTQSCNSRKRRRIIGVAGSCPIAGQVASLLDSQLLTMQQLLRVELLLNGWLAGGSVAD
jgi:hypothetical protein